MPTDYLVEARSKNVWQQPVADKDLTTAPAASKGDRHIIAGTGGIWSGGAINDIAQYNGASWDFATPVEGWFTWVEDENLLYKFTGVVWEKYSYITGTYTTSFVDGDLAAGVLTVTHNLNSTYPIVLVYDNNHKVIIPNEIEYKTVNTVDIDLSSYGTLTGTWDVRVVGGIAAITGTLTIRPAINIDEIRKQAVPNQVQVGVFFGYSLPIWNSDHEELYMSQSVPKRWNSASDIVVHLLVCLSGAEDEGDYFKFQLSWNNVADDSDVVPATTHDVTAEQAVLVGRIAQYNVYELTFIIDYDADGVGNEIQAHDLLSYRLRRVDATNPDVSNEIIVLDWHDHFQVNKIFGS